MNGERYVSPIKYGYSGIKLLDCKLVDTPAK